MNGVNKVILFGTCGKDPDIAYMPNGNCVANLSLATSEQWTDQQSGEKVKRTEWHRVVLYGKTAETAGKFLKKGSTVYIEGKNQTREWEKDGVKRYTTEVVVDMRGTMQLAGNTRDREDSSDDAQPDLSTPAKASSSKPKAQKKSDALPDGSES